MSAIPLVKPDIRNIHFTPPKQFAIVLLIIYAAWLV